MGGFGTRVLPRHMQHDHLNALESESIFIMREAFAKFDNMAMLWSIGKDSTALDRKSVV